MNVKDLGKSLYICKWFNQCIETHYNSILTNERDEYCHPKISLDNRIKSIEDEHDMIDYNCFDMSNLSDIEKFKVMTGNSKYSFDYTGKRYKFELILLDKSTAVWMNLNTLHTTADGYIIYSKRAYELWWKLYKINYSSDVQSISYLKYPCTKVDNEILIDIYREELELKLYVQLHTSTLYKN